MDIDGDSNNPDPYEYQLKRNQRKGCAPRR